MQTLDELAKVAEWHDFEAADYSATGNTARANHHTTAAATIRAAMGENERLRVFIGNLANNPQRATQAQIREACAVTLRAALNQKGPAHD